MSHVSKIPTDQPDYHVRECRFIQGKRISQSQQTHLPSLMCNLSYKVFTNWNLRVLLFPPEIIFQITHTSIDMHSSCRIPPLCDCLSIWCAIWATKWCQLWHLRVLSFSPNSFAFIKFNYTDLKIRLFKMMYLHAWSKAKLISWALFFPPIMRSSNWLTNMRWIRFAIVD